MKRFFPFCFPSKSSIAVTSLRSAPSTCRVTCDSRRRSAWLPYPSPSRTKQGPPRSARPCVAPPVARLLARSEVLLTADEAVAILESGGTQTAASNIAAATPEAETSPGASGATNLEAREAEAEPRREAEALSLLLANPGGGGGGVPGGAAAEAALTRLAARYLVRETVRGKIPDPVGNFHVRILRATRSHVLFFFAGSVPLQTRQTFHSPLPFGDAALGLEEPSSSSCSS